MNGLREEAGRTARPSDVKGISTNRLWPVALLGAAVMALLGASASADGGSRGTPSPTGIADGEGLTPDEKIAALERWEVVTAVKPTVGGGRHRVRADAICNAPGELVKSVLLDVRGYEKFMPKVTRSRVLKSDGAKMQVLIETRLPWPIENSWNILKVAVAPAGKEGWSITWDRVTGSMKENNGFWLLSPYGENTRLAYEIEVYVPPVLPDFAVDRGFRKVAADYVNALRNEVKRRREAGASL